MGIANFIFRRGAIYTWRRHIPKRADSAASNLLDAEQAQRRRISQGEGFLFDWVAPPERRGRGWNEWAKRQLTTRTIQ